MSSAHSQNLTAVISLSFTLLFVMICLFWGLDSYGLLHNNEGLYAQIPREMLETGNFILPHLNGVPYIEKPPLLYWFIALSYKLFGMNEFAARLIPALAGFLLVITQYHKAKKYFPASVAFLGALILGTSLGFAVLSRMVFFDVLFTFFLSLALWEYFDWEQTQRKFSLRWGYIFLGLAVLTKGFVALVLSTLVVIISNLLNRKPLMKWWDILDAGGVVLFLAITVPWHLAAAQQDPGFSWFYFVNEHFLRFLGEREPKDYYHGPWYYYTYRVFIYLLPWGFFLSLFLVPLKPAAISPAHAVLKRFLTIWFWSFFIFFSLSKAKANYYLVTALLPLALLLAQRIETSWHQRKNITIFLGMIFPILWSAAIDVILLDRYHIIALEHLHKNAVLEQALQYFSGAHFIMLLGLIGITGWAMWKKNRSHFLFLLNGFMSVVVIVSATKIAPLFEDFFSAHLLVRQLYLKPEKTCLYRDYEKISSFVFYLRKPLPIIDSVSNDLLYGQQTYKASPLFLKGEADVIKEQCNTIIVRRDRLQEFKQRFPDYHGLIMPHFTDVHVFKRN